MYQDPKSMPTPVIRAEIDLLRVHFKKCIQYGHGISPKESKREQELVQEYCTRHGFNPENMRKFLQVRNTQI